MFDQPNAPYDPKFCNCAGIYRVDVGPKFYIGSTTRLGSRHSAHLTDLKRGQHPNKALQAAWDEHGVFQFTVLTLIPEKACDRGRDHAERLKFHEQRLLDQVSVDPGCCNASESSRYNTGIAESMRRKWQDPEFRERSVRRLREARRGVAVSAETRAKMSAAKRGARNPFSRPVWLELPGGTREEFESATAAARRVGVTQQLMHQWLTGAAFWPGTGPRLRTRMKHLVGLRGGFVNPVR